MLYIDIYNLYIHLFISVITRDRCMHAAKGLYVLYIPSRVSPGRVDEFKNFDSLKL